MRPRNNFGQRTPGRIANPWDGSDDEHSNGDINPIHRGSLRERKKADTRQRLAYAAVELWLEQGAELTTVAAITARAGVSTRTFHNYFARRDDAFLYFVEGVFHKLAGLIRRAPADQPAVTILRDILIGEIYDSTDELGSARNLMHLGEHLSLSLSPEEKFRAASMFDVMSDALHEKADGRLTRFQAHMLVHLAFTAASSAIETFDSPDAGSDRELDDLLNEAFSMLQQGFKA